MRIIRRHFLFLSFVFSTSLLCNSCVEDNNAAPKIDESVEYGAYSFTITGGPCESIHYEGDMVEKTDWDPQTGFIYLENDPDYDNKQIMTMYIYYDINYILSLNPLNSLSTSCIVFGPTDEAKPRLYKPASVSPSARLDSVKIGNNFIAGKIVNWKYNRVLVYPEDQPEQITVNGQFVARMR